MTIEFKDFSFRYAALQKPTLHHINLTIRPGEKIAIIGPSGSGKSTLGQCLNGLIPHAVEGEIHGQLLMNGIDTSLFELHDFTCQIGTVLQDTDSQFVGLSVGEDIAFALENQRCSTVDMYPIVQSTAKMVDLAAMLSRSPHDLSGGQKQRVSLAGVLVDQVQTLLFDEPLAALDPKTGKKTIEIIDALHQSTNKTIIIIEHRLEDILHRHIDRVILMNAGRIIADTTPDALLASPLLAQYGIREPLYLSALKSLGNQINAEHSPAALNKMPIAQWQTSLQRWNQPSRRQPFTPSNQAIPLLSVHDLSYSYDGEKPALDAVSFAIHSGEFVAVLGKNGSGKSTITKLLMGVIEPDGGQMLFNGQPLTSMSIFERSQHIGVVMQNPNHMISHHMIFDEVAFGLRNRGLDESTIQEKVLTVLKYCGLARYRHWPVDALSYGQKKRVTLASILVLEPKLLILDEPTAGQDLQNYTSMMSFVEKLNRELGIAVMIISHDMHLVLEYASRAIVMADSEIIASAPVTQVFSQPTLLEQANLTTTSLYELADMADIEDKDSFMQHFIDHEKAQA